MTVMMTANTLTAAVTAVIKHTCHAIELLLAYLATNRQTHQNLSDAE
jgi:hypothetical protein